MLEIKFDKGRGRTFDGYKHDIVEIEIEVKDRGPKITEKDIEKALDRTEKVLMKYFADSLQPCLLYTYDAADERSSEDLGGRRKFKKKTNQ